MTENPVSTDFWGTADVRWKHPVFLTGVPFSDPDEDVRYTTPPPKGVLYHAPPTNSSAACAHHWHDTGRALPKKEDHLQWFEALCCHCGLNRWLTDPIKDDPPCGRFLPALLAIHVGGEDL